MRIYENEMKITKDVIKKNSQNSMIKPLSIVGKFKDALIGNYKNLKKIGYYKDSIRVLSQSVLVNTKLDDPKLFNTIMRDMMIDNIGDTVGYTIKNIGNFTIKGILIPNYMVNPKTKKAEGGVTEVDLEPGKTIDLPTKWATLLFSRIDYMGQACNGKFIPISKKQNSIDEYFTSFKFISNSGELQPKVIGTFNTITKRAQIVKNDSLVYSYLENASKPMNIKIDKNSAILVGLALKELEK